MIINAQLAGMGGMHLFVNVVGRVGKHTHDTQNEQEEYLGHCCALTSGTSGPSAMQRKETHFVTD